MNKYIYKIYDRLSTYGFILSGINLYEIINNKLIGVPVVNLKIVYFAVLITGSSFCLVKKKEEKGKILIKK